MKHLFIYTSLFFFSLSLCAAQDGQVIAFVNSEAESRADSDFKENILPSLKSYAKDQGMEFFVKEAKAGVPTVVRHTPMVFFQNHRGRSTFTARKHQLKKYLNFINTARLVEQRDAFLNKKDVCVRLDNRMKIAAQFKITDLKGVLPSDFDQAAFRQKMKTALAEGLSDYSHYDSIFISTSDRIFYMDFHPYLSGDGRLYLSSELYAQFNCIEPIYAAVKQPLSGKWDAAATVFAEAGKKLAAEIVRLSNESEIGDAFEPVKTDTPIVMWNEMGLSLPKAPEVRESKNVDFEAEGEWYVTGAIDEKTPLIQFTFLSPLDYYSGTVDNLEGSLDFPKGGLKEVKGEFKVKLSGLTMGDTDLDQAITGFILNAADFPTASFSLGESEGEDLLWDKGQGAAFRARGVFELSGTAAPVPVNARLEPIVLEGGAIGLNVFARFQLKLKDDFKIAKGPDGPSPAKQTLVFYMNFQMKKK